MCKPAVGDLQDILDVARAVLMTMNLPDDVDVVTLGKEAAPVVAGGLPFGTQNHIVLGLFRLH